MIRDQTARRDPLLQPLLLSGVCAGLALVLLTLIGDQPIQAAALMVVVLISVVTWRWPVAVTVVFVALIPVNRFLILLLFHFTHSDTLTKFAQLWKDWLLVLLLARVVHVALFSKDSKTVKVLDVLVFAFIALTLVYLVWDGGGSGVDVTTRIYGARLDAFFLIAYFVGRGLTLERKHVRRIALALIPGSVLVGLVALWQMIQPAGTNRLLDALDYQGFMRLQGTTGEAIAVRARFFQGGSIPRASSLMLGDLALAFFQIFVVALAAAIFFTARTNRARIWSGAFLLLMAATEVMTVTRSATIGVLVVIAVLAILAMAVFRLALFGLIGGLGCVIALLALGPQTAVLNQLLNPQEESLLAHERVLSRSLIQLQDNPLGSGLGTAGSVSQRFFTQSGITPENWYLQLANEMGIVAALLFVLVIVAMVIACVREYLGVLDFWLRVIVLTSIGAGIGFLVVGNFLHAWENLILSMVIWLFAGIAVRSQALERRWSAAETT